MITKAEGNIKWFNSNMGYGFAVTDGGMDVFIHYRAILSDAQYRTLEPGQRVAFIQVKSKKGWKGAEVEVLKKV